MDMGERTFQVKYKVPTASEFFETFSKKLKNTKLPKWDETVPWTKQVLKGILHDMGEEFGFEPQEEWLTVDQLWVLYVERQVATIGVAIEHEASVESWEDVVDDEGNKLTDVKAHLKVLVYYPELSQFDAFVRGWASTIRMQELRLAQERYLAVGICGDKENKQLVIKGAELTPEGKISPLPEVRIPYSQF
jgi:hypothetical protein